MQILKLMNWASVALFLTSGALFALFFLTFFDLNTFLQNLSYIAQIATAGTIVIALLTFFYQTQHDKNIAAIDLVAFFRAEIIPQKGSLNNRVNEVHKGKYDFAEQRIALQELSLWWLYFNHKSIVDKQKIAFEKDTGSIIELMKLFNLLEEFSLRVIYTNVVQHEALASLHKVYVASVEENSVRFLTLILHTPNSYPGIRRLYSLWKDYGDRETEEQKLARAADLLGKAKMTRSSAV